MCPEKDSGENNSNGISNNNYFDSSALHVSSLLEKGYYHEFMQSSFYAKYQVGYKSWTRRSDNLIGKSFLTRALWSFSYRFYLKNHRQQMAIHILTTVGEK